MEEWYASIKAESPLEQGDLIPACPIIIPPDQGPFENWKDFEIKTYDVIIMTQSCDLHNRKIELVQVCPYFSLKEFCQDHDEYNHRKMKENLRRGYSPSYHLLNKCNILNDSDFLVVDYRSTFSISFKFLEEYRNSIGNRIRINSPYKEHLSQAYARFYMRVGLPTDIPSFRN